MKNHLMFAFGITLLTAFIHLSADAAVVKRVKGSSILVDLESDTAQEGDTYFLIDEEGKKKAIVKITKVKDTQAIAKVMKGKPGEGMTLLFRPKKEAASSRASHAAAAGSSQSRSHVGALFGFSMADMSVKITQGLSTTREDLKGPSFSGHAFIDYAFWEKIGIRSTFGVQQFNATGNKRCGDVANQTCDANILYANLNFMGRFLFSNGEFRPWVGGGAGFLFPISKSSTALTQSSITSTSIGFGAAGFDWFLSPTDFLPLSVEYGMLPSSADVSANMISVRFGYGTTF